VDDVDSQFVAAPHLQENLLSRQRVGNCTGAGDTVDTCAIGNQQQRVEALRFLYNSPFTRHARQAAQTEQDNNSGNLKIDDDDTTINPGNNPMIGSILEYRKANVARKPQQEFLESLSADDSTTMESKGPFQFVERVLALHHELVVSASAEVATANPQQHEQIYMVAIDDMYFMAERMFQKQAEFRLLGKLVHVDIGYHYTHAQNLDHIRTNGLLSRAEQYESGIAPTQMHGMALGDGIYTGNNPDEFSRFGTVGILVARLKGQTCHPRPRLYDPNCDDTVEYAVNDDLSRQMVVLKSSSQCIPLVHFSKSMIIQRTTTAAPFLSAQDVIALFHDELQNIVDEFFNKDARPTAGAPLAASTLQSPTLQKRAPISTTWNPRVP
jgi:hypothetical protein